MARIAPRFARVEPRRRARAFLIGLMAGLPRTNCWSIAEHAGQTSPDGMQRLLNGVVWDEQAVLEDLRAYVVEHLGDPGAVLVVDETGDLKKGTGTVAVQRQYSGTAGRVENCQVAVYLTYAAPAGYAFIDRSLYLPKSWPSDPDRCAAVGVPNHVRFATKPAQATAMLERALDAGVPAALGHRRRGVWRRPAPAPGPGTAPDRVRAGGGQASPDHHRDRRPACDLAVRVPARSWQRISAGRGAKGERWYDWALIDTLDPAAEVGDRVDQTGCHWLLIRRNPITRELAFYRAYSPTPVRLAALDQHQVRRWTSWHRWTALAMLAHALLSVLAATAPLPDPETGLIRLTRNEIRRLLTAAIAPIHKARHALHWSIWRRGHQARARASHYRRREEQLT